MEELAPSETKEETSKVQPEIEVDGGKPGPPHTLSGTAREEKP
jgi:hypothetical protein